MLITLYLVASLQALVLLAVIYLLLQRALRAIWRQYLGRRIRKYEPLVLDLLQTPQAVDPLTRGLRTFDRGIVEGLLLQQAGELEGQDRENMTRVLEQTGYVDEMIARLGSRSWWRRLEAASKLGVMRSRWSIPALLQSCYDSAEEVRLAAVRSLAEMNDTSGLRLLFQALEDTSGWTPERVAEALWSIGPGASAEVRAEIARTASPVARRLYIRIVGLLRDNEAVVELSPLLADGDAATRIEAIRAISAIGYVTSLDHMVAVLADADSQVRAEAARALGLLQDPGAVEPLTICLQDPSPEVRYNAGWALCKLGQPGSDAVREAARGGHPLASQTASQVLVETLLGVDSQRV